MRKFFPVFVWWSLFVIAWSIYRFFQFDSEVISEVVIKPLIWLGSVVIAWKVGVIPKVVFTDLRQGFMLTKPFWKVYLLPAVAITVYFFLINTRSVEWPQFALPSLLWVLIINFTTGFVEEFTYRGVLYVWLLDLTDEVTAFALVQVLFVVAHIPTLYLNSPTFESGLVHAFFIVLIGAIHTGIFRWTRSLYASTVTHGIWNSLVHYLLVGAS